MKNFFYLLILISFFVLNSCAGSKKSFFEDDKTLYTVKVINSSVDKILLRYSNTDLSYTFKFVDENQESKFTMNGNLIIQYSLTSYDDAKIIKIKQDTLIQVKQNDILIDDLPSQDKIKTEDNKKLEPVK